MMAPALHALPSPASQIALDAISEAAATAENYARAAGALAAVGDIRGVAHSIRCAAAALSCASRATLALCPAETGGAR